MQPNAFDRELTQAIEAARSEVPTADAERRLRLAMQPSRRTRTWLPRFVVVGALAAAAFVVPSLSREKSAAWAQVMAATGGVTRYHEVLYFRVKGERQKSVERWVDGKRLRVEFRREIQTTWLTNGKLTWHVYGSQSYDTVQRSRPMPSISLLSGFTDSKSISVKDLLASSRIIPKGEPVQVEGPDGPRLRYTLANRDLKALGGPGEFIVEVKLNDPRVVHWESLFAPRGVVFEGDLDYPEEIASSTFEYQPRPGARLYDLDAGKAAVRNSLKGSLGRRTLNGHTVDLCGAFQDVYGSLWVLWKGTPPNGDMRPPVLVDGRPKVPGHGTGMLTSWQVLMRNDSRREPWIPYPLAGMSVRVGTATLRKVGLKVPVFAPDRRRPIRKDSGEILGYQSKFVGYVRYADVPVTEIGPSYPALDGLVMNIRKPSRDAKSTQEKK